MRRDINSWEVNWFGHQIVCAEAGHVPWVPETMASSLCPMLPSRWPERFFSLQIYLFSTPTFFFTDSSTWVSRYFLSFCGFLKDPNFFLSILSERYFKKKHMFKKKQKKRIISAFLFFKSVHSCSHQARIQLDHREIHPLRGGLLSVAHGPKGFATCFCKGSFIRTQLCSFFGVHCLWLLSGNSGRVQ